MEDIDYFDSGLLDHEMEIQKDVIERNKACPGVRLGYDDRSRIWVDQILPDRLMQIRTQNTVDYVNRMLALLGADVRRLADAADRQYDGGAAHVRVHTLTETYARTTDQYAREITRIEAEASDDSDTITQYDSIRDDNPDIVQ